MFTGIIEEIGTVKDISKSSAGMRLKISCKKVLENSVLGDSIAVNGVCLTIAEMGSDYFIADVMNETVNVSSLRKLGKNSGVNLERALTLSKPLGGHFVLGHVDCTGDVKSISSDGFSTVISIAYPSEFSVNTIYKGSISVNGVSLTIHELEDQVLKIKLIPHSLKETNLKDLKSGDLVNLEFDFLGKYALRLLTESNKSSEAKSSIDESFLMKNGFM